MLSKTLTSHLRAHFKDSAKYMLSNSFVFDPKNWESDLLIVGKNNMLHELELKVGKTDFELDARKPKHRIFYDRYTKPRRFYPLYKKNVYNGPDGPNFFSIEFIQHLGPIPHQMSYCCPEGLIKFDEVPKHAGLIWVRESGEVSVVKVAPKIHSKPIDLRDILLEKFYWQATAFEEKWHNEIISHEKTKKLLEK